jgi:hypothetical protein
MPVTLDLKQRYAPSLSDSQVAVLRKLVKDANFRKDFLANPIDAVAKSGVKMSASDLASIEKVTAAQLEAIEGMVATLPPGLKAADGTHTLAYAVAFAVVVALLVAMPNPMDIAAGVQARE